MLPKPTKTGSPMRSHFWVASQAEYTMGNKKKTRNPMMKGRAHLSIDDISQVAQAVLRHRVILNFDAHADGHTTETILPEILKGVASQAAATR